MLVPAVGVAGKEFTVILKVLAGLMPHVLLPVTLSVPEAEEAEKLTVIVLVPLPEIIANPVPEYDQV